MTKKNPTSSSVAERKKSGRKLLVKEDLSIVCLDTSLYLSSVLTGNQLKLPVLGSTCDQFETSNSPVAAIASPFLHDVSILSEC